MPDLTIDLAGIKKLFKAVDFLKVNLSHNKKECPIQKATIYMSIIVQEGITLNELVNMHGFHQTTISRHVKELSTFKEKISDDVWETHGCGLVTTEPYEYNRREFAVF